MALISTFSTRQMINQVQVPLKDKSQGIALVFSERMVTDNIHLKICTHVDLFRRHKDLWCIKLKEEGQEEEGGYMKGNQLYNVSLRFSSIKRFFLAYFSRRPPCMHQKLFARRPRWFPIRKLLLEYYVYSGGQK